MKSSRCGAAAVERGSIRSVISTNGKIEPAQNFEAHAPTNTTVRRLLVKEGDHVRKGQLLLRLDDASVRSQAAHAQAELQGRAGRRAEHRAWRIAGRSSHPASADHQSAHRPGYRTTQSRRLQASAGKGAASAGEVKEAENAPRRAQADLRLADAKQKERYSKPEVEHVTAQQSDAQAAYSAAEDILHKSNITSPFDRRRLRAARSKQGAYVQAGDLLLQVADLSKVLVRAYVDEPGYRPPCSRTEDRSDLGRDARPHLGWHGHQSSLNSEAARHAQRKARW